MEMPLPSHRGGSVDRGVAGESVQQSRVITVNANNPSIRQFNIGINLKFKP
jgi:hypothetical protein